MILKVSLLVAAIAQVVAAAYLSIGTFETSERPLQVFIQPAGWAFSIWGLIYVLSFVYAVYQLIPKYDNKTLRATRMPALVGFLGSIVWLYFAGMDSWLVWLTIPVLFLMAAAFVFVVRVPNAADSKQTILSKKILLPYAAWTGIASWINVQALLNDQSVITTDTVNVASNAVLFACIAVFTLTYFKKTSYSVWYGGVLVWAGVGVIYANLNGGSMLFTILAGSLIATVVGLYTKERLSNQL